MLTSQIPYEKEDMRILYITLEDVSLHKGSVVHVNEVVNGLQKHGHFVGLVASSSNRMENTNHFYNLKVMGNSLLKLLGLKKQPYIISSFFLFLYLLIVLPRYDIIYARDYHTAIIAYLPRILFKKRLVYEINGLASEEEKLKGVVVNQFISCLIQKAEKIATRYSNRIISVTPQIRTYLIENFKCQPEKVNIIGNGVNPKMFFPTTDTDVLSQWRSRLGVGSEELLVVFIGNLARWQGVDIFIESGFRLLRKNEKIKFLIVGDGVLKENLMKKVLASGLKHKYIFTGMVNYKDIPFLINIADIGVAPFIFSRNCHTGVSPLKVYEYMACAKPVVASRIDGLEFIEEEGVGKLVEPGNVDSLTNAIDDLLNSREKREQMGYKGLKIAVEKFNWELKISEIEKTFREII